MDRSRLKESALGIDAGDDGLDGDFFAVGEHDAGDGAIFDANVPHFRVGANFHAGLLGGFGQRAGERTETAARKSGGADGMRIGRGAKKQNRGGTGGPRTQRGAENSASGDHGAEQFGFEKFGDKIGDGHRAPAQQIEDAVLCRGRERRGRS